LIFSSWLLAQLGMGFEPTTSSLPMKCSTN
jgi:hypothetical protein